MTDKPADDARDDAKPSLQDIAAHDSESRGDATPQDASGEQPDPSNPAAAPGAKQTGGRGFVWFVFVLIIIGGAVAVGWPYIGPKVEPVVADLRQLMGLTPRPTQVSMPSERPALAEPAPQAPAPQSPQSPQSQESEDPAAQAPAPQDGPQDVMVDPQSAPQDMPQDIAPSPASATAPALDADAVATRLAVLESRIDALGARDSRGNADGEAALEASAELADALTALKSEIVALAARIQALEDGTRADPTAPAQALVLAATQVRARLMGDDPFAAELAALEHIAAGDATVTEAISRLRPHAEVGVPTEAALTARFAKVAKAIVGARTSGEAEGWLGRVKDGLGGLVTVRRTDPAAITDEVERAVAVAEAALELGELGEAVNALSPLEGAPGDAAAAWLGDARARVEAEAALEELHRHALAALSAAGGR